MLTALLLPALACTTSSACHSESIDLRPMPSSLPDPAAFRSYICDHGDVGIPAHAVELMTGLPADLTAYGHFDLGPAPDATANVCRVYSPSELVLEIYLADLGDKWKENVFDKRLQAGGTPMPSLLPDAVGVYWAGPTADMGPVRGSANTLNEARAYLFRKGTELGIRLLRGAPGRDNAADVLALTRLIAPTLMPR
ncbi:hypothetical protein ACWDA3_50720 [Nonomuraea rubra]